MENQENKKTLTLAVTGGIAVYKAVDVASKLAQQGLDVTVLMTESAQQFVAPLSFEAVVRKKAITTDFPENKTDNPESIYPHIYPASRSDMFLVVPATANILAKLACGIADDVVSASALALPPECIKVICPAMNVNMWNSVPVQNNIQTLAQRGWHQIGPESGHLACADKGQGRLSQPASIVEKVMELLSSNTTPRPLDGKTVLILSGPTHEYIDPVRFISNASSGKMGKSLALQARKLGAKVEFVTGPVPQQNIPQSDNINITEITSAAQMFEAAKQLYSSADITFFAAAVADYTPKLKAEQKKHKDPNGTNLELMPTQDIAAFLGKEKKKGQKNIGFALETQNGENSAIDKLKRKNLDAIILNGIDSFSNAKGTFTLFKPGQPSTPWGNITKSQCAELIFNSIL